MKFKILSILVLTILSTFPVKSANFIKFTDLRDSTFIWVKEKASIERVNRFLSPNNVSAYKGKMVLLVKAGDEMEEWVVTAKTDIEGRIEYMNLILRRNKEEYSKLLIKGLALKFSLEIKPYYFVQDGMLESESRCDIYGVSAKNNSVW